MSNYSDSEFTDDPNTPWYKVLSLIPKKAKVLDVGCSSGNFDEIIIKEKQCIIDGVELDLADAKVAENKIRKVLNINIESDSLKGLDTDYDVIYFGDVIEHLVHPVETLQRIKPLLSKGGSVIFSIPNMAHISVRLMLLSGKFEYGGTGLLDNTHLHYYDKTEVERVFAEAGYELEMLDWVSRDIPKELLVKDLASKGLSANEKFFKLASSVEAGAYQFIGKATPTAKKARVAKRPKISPAIDMFENHLADIRESYEQEVNRIEKQKAELSNKLAAYDAEIEALRNQSAGYETSLSWKVTKPLRKTSGTIKKLRSKQ
jgi:2-polyprenyl-3-methyl-5-hydroxy-6-metoxy-1,4-benzoquinol methylase